MGPTHKKEDEKASEPASRTPASLVRLKLSSCSKRALYHIL